MRGHLLCGMLSLVALVACGGGDATGSGETTTGPGTEGTSTSTPPAPPAAATPPTATPPPAAQPKPKAVRFVAFGDAGTGDNGQVKIANAVAAKCAKDGCDHVQLLGDNFYPSGTASVNDPIWQSHFETPYAAINLDFFAVLGNHDYGANGAGTDFPKGQNEVDYTAKSAKWKMPSAYYHFTKGDAGGDVEFFALDTNKAFFGMAGDQKTDVASWIAASKATWKIALGHHPYKSNGPHGNAGSYDKLPIPPVNGASVKSFLEDTVCGKVDLYLSGHDHSQQWLNESCKGTELAVSGAGAKTTELPGTNPSLFQSLALGFLYVVIEGKTLTCEFVDENGVVEFTHVMKKP